MDELEIIRLLGDGGEVDVAAARARAGARLELRMRGSRRRRVVVLVCAVAFAALAAPALAFHDGLIRFLHGSPPAPAVRAELQRLPRGYTAGGAHDYVELTTSVGAQVTLWAASGPDGRAFGLQWTPAAGAAETRLPNSVLSVPSGSPAQHPLFVGQSGSRVAGSWIDLLWGRADPAIASLELVSADGRSENVPFSDGYFLVETPSWNDATDLVARDASGSEVARRAVDVAEPPTPAGPRETLVTSQAGGRDWTLFRYPTTDGHRCDGVEASANGASEDDFQCGIDPPTDANPVVAAGPARWANRVQAGDTVCVFGLAAPTIASIELVYADGSVDRATLANGGFVDLAPFDDARGLPTRLEAFDASGNKVLDRPLAG
jgi:hypothetical protein